eukprot:TRINITY_DN2414_c0_g1_i1.p1 TRINITY_DN2414_c0_g1~~TRINITY_DN2414_c0_g1_i1.p1  ORF type:complete len:1121 (+),score=186.47 TRINITY_DN2414_c0_g1_i1:47-3409(+)
MSHDAESPEVERVSACYEDEENASGDLRNAAAGDSYAENLMDDVGEEEVIEDEGENTTEELAPEVGAKTETVVGVGDGSDIHVESFSQLHIDESLITSAQACWKMFIQGQASREAAGEAVYSALFDAAPSLQPLFVTPRAVQAMKFMAGLNQFVNDLNDPASLMVAVETLGFGHLALEVTVPRVIIFRNAILDLFNVELGSRFSTDAYNGWKALLNYVGGAIIYIKASYADRIQLLGESWSLCFGKDKDSMASSDDMSAKKQSAEDSKDLKDGHQSSSAVTAQSMMQNIPTTFPQMFQFNAAVMGFGQSIWMNEVLSCFDNIVSNVANSGRLVEECDVLVCRISKVASGKVNLSEFKACMLASLRSLLPKDWTTSHEVAWSWLWENVERLLAKNMGMPPVWQKAYSAFLDGVDDATGYQMRKDIFLLFFSLAPAGQDYFKQSNTYLHLVATKVLAMVLDIFRDPVAMVDDISALGLRHVGYAIPTEFMPPFASACVEVVQGLTRDDACIDGFQWSLGLISKSLVRTILEGSTIVMKAINANTTRSLKRAISVAARGERASWMLLIRVGTQSISPLAWAIESGALESAKAMIEDLLIIRADRDRYYYAADDLFDRHFDVVRMLLNNAPGLLYPLFDGLIWRSRITVGGMRRVNYYFKHLLIDPEGKFAKTLDWVVRAKDPKVVCHPVLVLLADIVWSRIACRSFFLRKMWFLITLVGFTLSQAIFENLQTGTTWQRMITFVLRIFIYVFCMGSMLITHSRTILDAYLKRDTIKLVANIAVPAYWANWQDAANLALACLLCVMVCTEPVVYCFGEKPLFTTNCDHAASVRFFPYSVVSMLAMLLYWSLLIDLAVFSNKISAYVLVCGRMVVELLLFIAALVSVLLSFSSSISCLEQPLRKFQSIPQGALSLWEIVLGVFGEKNYELLSDQPVVFAGCFVFLAIVVFFLLNLLIAQLSCAYDAIYVDMVGYARLKRIRIIVESMPHVSPSRWDSFVAGLGFDERIEFNEGDVGLANGMQVHEPSASHPTTTDMIRRFGGSTSPKNQWPEEETTGDDDSDRFERLETLIKRSMENLKATEKSRRGGRDSGASETGGSASGSLHASGSGISQQKGVDNTDMSDEK